MRLLVIEDDARLGDVIARGLTDAGHAVDLHVDGRGGLQAFEAGGFDAVVIDWMLPGLDGAAVCRAIRARGDTTPILMLTARRAVPDRVAGLDAGADDYLTKPFAFEELLARLRAFARRRPPSQARIAIGELAIDVERRTVTMAGARVELTVREFDLLVALATRADRPVSRLQILDEVWDGETDLRSNVIDVHVAKLRAKLGRPFGHGLIETVRGVGFRLRGDTRR